MVKNFAVIAVVAVLATSAFAGTFGYQYSLPGETDVYSSTLMGITPVNHESAVAGDWFVKRDTAYPDPWGYTDYAAFTSTGLNLDDPNISWAAGAGYLMPTTIDMINGPVGLYFTASTPFTLGNPGWAFGGFYNNAVPSTGAPAVQIGARGEPGPGRFGFQSYGDKWGSNGQSAGDVDPGWCYSIQNTDAIITPCTYTKNVLATGASLKMRVLGYMNPDDYTITSQVQVYANGLWQPLSPMTNIHAPGSTDPNVRYFSAYVNEGSDADRAGQIDSLFFFGGAGYGHGGTSNGMKYTNLVVTQGKYGDNSFDNAVSTTDYYNALANLGTAAPASIVASGAPMDLLYDPATGNVKIDTKGQAINGFTLSWGVNGFQTANETNALAIQSGGTDSSYTHTGSVLGEVLAAPTTFEGVLNLGNVGKVGQTQAWLIARTGNNYASNGGTLYNLNAIVVPEPATMCLLALGALGILARRRHA